MGKVLQFQTRDERFGRQLACVYDICATGDGFDWLWDLWDAVPRNIEEAKRAIGSSNLTLVEEDEAQELVDWIEEMMEMLAPEDFENGE